MLPVSTSITKMSIMAKSLWFVGPRKVAFRVKRPGSPQEKDGLKRVLATLRYSYLNELDQFGGKNPTIENVSKYIFGCIAPEVKKDRLSGMKVTTWESSSAFASYQERW